MLEKLDRSTMVMAAACAVVGVVAALGKFNAMMNFPLVFAGVCLAFGLLSLWRGRERTPVAPSAVVLVVGALLAVAGWVYQGQVIREGMARTEREVFALLGGKPAASLAGLEPLGIDQGALDAAVSFAGPATIVTFWATWCSPCWAEMAELQELYREYREEGLSVVAVTSYDHPETEEGRERDRSEAVEFLRRRGLEYPAGITADDAVYGGYDVRSIPSTALVDGSGTVVAYSVGLSSARLLMAKAAELAAGG